MKNQTKFPSFHYVNANGYYGDFIEGTEEYQFKPSHTETNLNLFFMIDKHKEHVMVFDADIQYFNNLMEENEDELIEADIYTLFDPANHLHKERVFEFKGHRFIVTDDNIEYSGLI